MDDNYATQLAQILFKAHGRIDAETGETIDIGDEVQRLRNICYRLQVDSETLKHVSEQSQLPPAARHDLYAAGDENSPDSIKDRNGEVVLGLCKVCGKAESELSEPCSRAEQSQRVPEKISDYPDYGEVWDYYVEGWNDCIDEMLATAPKPGGK